MKSNNLVDYTELVDEVKFENGQIDDNAFSDCGVLSKRGCLEGDQDKCED